MNVLSGLMSVRMILRHVVYVSYCVPASRMRLLVPRALSLSEVEPERSFVSVVAMRCRDVRLAGLPRPRFDYRQLNLRTYVTDPVSGGNAVYFLRSGVTSRAISRLTSLIGLPWERIQFELNAGGAGGRGLHFEASGRWTGEISISARESQVKTGDMSPFDSVESAVDHLTGPLVGFIGSEGHARRFEIRHRPLEVLSGTLGQLRFPLLDSTGLVEASEMQKPQNVLLVPEAEFTVCLPARRV
jgi:uncharacterized protein YqjF (DUF2071 family)